MNIDTWVGRSVDVQVVLQGREEQLSRLKTYEQYLLRHTTTTDQQQLQLQLQLQLQQQQVHCVALYCFHVQQPGKGHV